MGTGYLTVFAIVASACAIGAFLWQMRSGPQGDVAAAPDARLEFNRLPPIRARSRVDFQTLIQMYGVPSPIPHIANPESGRELKMLKAPGETALQIWAELRGAIEESEYWPILIGGKKDLDGLAETCRMSVPASIEEDIRRANSIDAASRLRSEEADEPESMEKEEGLDSSQSVANAGGSEFTANLDFATRKPLSEVYIALVPTKNSWEAPAYLSFGGWNACPHASEHAAIARYWNKRHGAEIVALRSDVVEMRVARPPNDEAGAFELAKQQYAYAPDIIDQGIGSLRGLASTLLYGEAWYFWWD